MIKKRMVGNALPEGEWRKTAEAAPLLGVTRQNLTQLVEKGYFIGGQHFLKLGDTDTSPRLWNIDSCRLVFAELAAPSFGRKYG